MSKKFGLLFLLVVGSLSGCVQNPLQPPSVVVPYDETTVIPTAPEQFTQHYRDVALTAYEGSRGGAGLRMPEFADVLANEHYVGVDHDGAIVNSVEKKVKRTPQKKPQKSSKDKSVYSDRSFYSQRKAEN